MQRRPVASPGAGRLKRLELLLEGLHLSVNGFDREESCQPRDGRVRRGIQRRGGGAGRMIFIGLGCSRDLGI